MVVQYPIRGKRASAIAASIERAIREQHLGAGELLPTVRALAARLRVSPATVASAYRTLRLRGLLAARQRAGTTVSLRPPLVTRPAPPVPAHARDLATGNPDPALLPSPREALAAVDPRPHLYGEPRARPELLALAAREFASEGISTPALTVVGGALDGVERVLQAHARPGDRVAVEDPGYPGVLDLVHALGLVPEPVALDDRGPLPDALAHVLRRRVIACVVTPRAQNPTGAALDAARAAELRAVLAAHPEVLVIEDDHAGPVAGAAAVTLCEEGRGPWAVVRSVSKSLGPDLRLAVVAADPGTVARVEGRLALGTGWVSHVLQSVVVHLWSDSRVRRALRAASDAYGARRAALVEALATHGIAAHGRSGMNVWIPVVEEVPVVRAMLDRGWAIAAGERYRVRSPPAVRVTIAQLLPEDAPRVAEALAASLAPPRHTRSA